ncbi:MAG: S8 family serine peptidase [Candidatus Eisenbacteria bacterium]
MIVRSALILSLGVLFLASSTYPGLSPSVTDWLEQAEGDETIVVWVFFSDKGESSVSDREARIREVWATYDPEAVTRRLRARPGRPFDEHDLPLNKLYIQALEDEGVTFRSFSRWLNAVSVTASRGQVERISGLGFVKRLSRVSGRRGGPALPVPDGKPKPVGALESYGESFTQLDMMQVTDLHDEGYTGTGVRVAIFDTGFWLEHECFSALNLIAQHDFINDDGETANEPGDPEYQHYHGTSCLSLLAANSPGILMGAAYGADYILAKTEDTSQEEPVEEDWWIEAVEWADSLGAQIITSSLCYNDWYTYEDMDGDTAPITIAADMAVLNGIVVTNAAGNSGAGSWKYILAPADGDSVISVGSVDSTGVRSYWSSQGPTYDGRIKPTIMAMGGAAYVARPSAVDDYGRGDGTSFATPLTAGALALVIQKVPTCTPPDVIDAVMMTGTRSSDPDSLYGWGILQAHDASNHIVAGIAGMELGTRTLMVYPNPSSGVIRMQCPGWDIARQAGIYDVRGRLVGHIEIPASGVSMIDLTSVVPGAVPGVLFVEVPGAGRTKVLVLR